MYIKKIFQQMQWFDNRFGLDHKPLVFRLKRSWLLRGLYDLLKVLESGPVTYLGRPQAGPSNLHRPH